MRSTDPYRGKIAEDSKINCNCNFLCFLIAFSKVFIRA